jgi:hypothetical protein
MTNTEDTQPLTIQDLQEGKVAFGERYLRNRPFLVITQTGRAARHVKTEVPGWAVEQNNWAVTERPVIVDRISDKMMTEASIIIDLLNTKLVKNRFAETGHDEKVMEYYLGKYSTEVTQGMQIWTSQMLGAAKAAQIMQGPAA